VNNSSLRTADRSTHIKIVAVSLVASIAVVAVGLMARNEPSGSVTARIQTDGPLVVKAGEPKTITANDNTAIR
jgi:hypothetical protein